MKIMAYLCAMLALQSASISAAEPAEVMVLGTYHFDNPGKDINNVRVDDVLQPNRQRELEALADILATFRPTKIVVERIPQSGDFVDPKYAAFTPAMLGQNRDERVQIAYRLARKLGHLKVYAVDEQPGPGEPDYFPFAKVADFAKGNGKAAQLEAIMAKGAAATRESEEKQARLSIPALLLDYNDPKSFLAGISPYYEMLGIGDGEQQPGAELNAMWYMRNAKIFAKLMKVAEPGDRMLVIYGAGHGYWLRHFASETPGFRNVDPLPYLKKAAAR